MRQNISITSAQKQLVNFFGASKKVEISNYMGDRLPKDSGTIQARWDADITFFHIWITTE